VVLYRGHLPCDVLFIGEAPGESEDGLGIPFIGDSGRCLEKLWNQALFSAGYPAVVSDPDGAIRESFTETGINPSYGITNIVACIPRHPGEHATGELRPPTKTEAEACRPRLIEILEMANPQLIALLGDTAKRFFPKTHNTPTRTKLNRWNGKLLHLVHPAAIIRQENLSHAQVMSKRFVLSLAAELKEIKDA